MDLGDIGAMPKGAVIKWEQRPDRRYRSKLKYRIVLYSPDGAALRHTPWTASLSFGVSWSE